jgi:hypothetical protein
MISGKIIHPKKTVQEYSENIVLISLFKSETEERNALIQWAKGLLYRWDLVQPRLHARPAATRSPIWLSNENQISRSISEVLDVCSS